MKSKITVLFILFTIFFLTSCMVQNIEVKTQPTIRLPLGSIGFEVAEIIDQLIPEDQSELKEMIKEGSPMAFGYSTEATTNINELLEQTTGEASTILDYLSFEIDDSDITKEASINLTDQIETFDLFGEGLTFQISEVEDLGDLDIEWKDQEVDTLELADVVIPNITFEGIQLDGIEVGIPDITVEGTTVSPTVDSIKIPADVEIPIVKFENILETDVSTTLTTPTLAATGFSTITFSEGALNFDVKIENASSSLNVKINSATLVDDSGIGIEIGATTISATTIEFGLAGKTLSNEFKIVLDITITGASYGGTFDLSLTPSFDENSTIKAASGINFETDVSGDFSIPLGDSSSTFDHVILNGNLLIESPIPEDWTGITRATIITLKQEGEYLEPSDTTPGATSIFVLTDDSTSSIELSKYKIKNEDISISYTIDLNGEDSSFDLSNNPEIAIKPENISLNEVKNLRISHDPIVQNIPKEINYGKFAGDASIDISFNDSEINFTNFGGKITIESTETISGDATIENTFTINEGTITSDLSGKEFYQDAKITVEATNVSLKVIDPTIETITLTPSLANLKFEEIGINTDLTLSDVKMDKPEDLNKLSFSGGDVKVLPEGIEFQEIDGFLSYDGTNQISGTEKFGVDDNGNLVVPVSGLTLEETNDSAQLLFKKMIIKGDGIDLTNGATATFDTHLENIVIGEVTMDPDVDIPTTKIPEMVESIVITDGYTVEMSSYVEDTSGSTESIAFTMVEGTLTVGNASEAIGNNNISDGKIKITFPSNAQFDETNREMRFDISKIGIGNFTLSEDSTVVIHATIPSSPILKEVTVNVEGTEGATSTITAPDMLSHLEFSEDSNVVLRSKEGIKFKSIEAEIKIVEEDTLNSTDISKNATPTDEGDIKISFGSQTLNGGESIEIALKKIGMNLEDVESLSTLNELTFEVTDNLEFSTLQLQFDKDSEEAENLDQLNQEIEIDLTELEDLRDMISYIELYEFYIDFEYNNQLPFDIGVSLSLPDFGITKDATLTVTLTSEESDTVRVDFKSESLDLTKLEEEQTSTTASIVTKIEGLDKDEEGNYTLTLNDFKLSDHKDKEFFGIETTFDISDITIGGIGIKNPEIEETTFSISDMEEINEIMDMLDDVENLTIDTLNSTGVVKFENIGIENLDLDLTLAATFNYIEGETTTQYSTNTVINISGTSSEIDLSEFLSTLINNFLTKQGTDLKISIKPKVENAELSFVDLLELESEDDKEAYMEGMNLIYDINIDFPLKFVAGEGGATLYHSALSEVMKGEESGEEFNLISEIKNAVSGEVLDYSKWLKNATLSLNVDNTIGMGVVLKVEETINNDVLEVKIDKGTNQAIPISLEKFIKTIQNELQKDNSDFDLEFTVLLPEGEHQINSAGAMNLSKVMLNLETDITYTIPLSGSGGVE